MTLYASYVHGSSTGRSPGLTQLSLSAPVPDRRTAKLTRSLPRLSCRPVLAATSHPGKFKREKKGPPVEMETFLLAGCSRAPPTPVVHAMQMQSWLAGWLAGWLARSLGLYRNAQ